MSLTNIPVNTHRPARLFPSLGVATLAVGLLLAGPASARLNRRASETPSPAVVAEGSAPGESVPNAPAAPSGEGSGEAAGASPPAESGARSTRSRGARALRAGRCAISIEVAPRQIASGESPTIAGALVCGQSSGAGGQVVTLYQRPHGAGAAGVIVDGTATTEANGSFRLTAGALNASSVLYVRCAGAHSARVALRVTSQITFIGSPDAAHLLVAGGHSHSGQNTVRFSGTVKPAGEDATVTLQRKGAGRDGHWNRIAATSVAVDGSYSIAHTFRVTGEVDVRAVVRTRGHTVVGVSQPLTYEISHEQNPRLTIEASAGPLSHGQSVTISGVAGRADHPVTLLARTQGSEFTAVASGMTDGAGSYTFIQSPTQSTAYRVTEGARRSTVLFEGVTPEPAAAAAAR